MACYSFTEWAPIKTSPRHPPLVPTLTDSRRYVTSCQKSSTSQKIEIYIASTRIHSHTNSALKMTILNIDFFLKSPKKGADRAARFRDSGGSEVHSDSPLSSHFLCLSILSVDLLPLSEEPWVSLPELRYILSTCLSASFR